MTSTQGTPILCCGELTRRLHTEAEIRQQRQERKQQKALEEDLARKNARSAQAMLNKLCGGE